MLARSRGGVSLTWSTIALGSSLHYDSSRILIGAAGMWRSDWRRWNVGALIGQSTCRLLALEREAIDSTCAGASGGVQSATTP